MPKGRKRGKDGKYQSKRVTSTPQEVLGQVASSSSSNSGSGSASPTKNLFSAFGGGEAHSTPEAKRVRPAGTTPEVTPSQPAVQVPSSSSSDPPTPVRGPHDPDNPLGLALSARMVGRMPWRPRHGSYGTGDSTQTSPPGARVSGMESTAQLGARVSGVGLGEHYCST